MDSLLFFLLFSDRSFNPEVPVLGVVLCNGPSDAKSQQGVPSMVEFPTGMIEHGRVSRGSPRHALVGRPPTFAAHLIFPVLFFSAGPFLCPIS